MNCVTSESGPKFQEKFIAFLDILGFKGFVEAAETGNGMPLSELLEVLKKLGSPDQREKFGERGPIACPQSAYLERNLDFRLTQISDSVVVSAEVSAAGIINLLNHCWSAVFGLLESGIMCRGYITRGLIFHTNTHLIGTGYQKAYENEGNVAAFKHEADERGTPFVEVDRSVCNYVSECKDWCVGEMFSRFVKRDGELAALFPFQRLAHSFIIAGAGKTFDPEKEKRANQNVRLWINGFKERVMALVDTSKPSAVRKAEHYIQALDAQLEVCDRTDEMIALLVSGFPSCDD